jgi:signal transduction histidine kinase
MSYDIEALQAENQQLRSQVNQLVWAERSLIEFQEQLDVQVGRYRQLNEIAQRLRMTFEPEAILKIVLEFLLYGLNFERCLILAPSQANPSELQAVLWEGYDGDEPEQVCLQEADWQFQQRFQQQDWLIYPAQAADMDVLAPQLGMDELMIGGLLRDNKALQYVICIGNTQAQAKYFSRVTPDADYLVVLSNLLAQVSGTLAQSHLYQSTLAQSVTLRQTLEQLQSTQSQLIQTEKMSSLGQLVAGIAHEINNPVNFINGNIFYAQTYTGDLLKLVAQYQQVYPTGSAEIQAMLDAIDFDFLQSDFPRVIDSMQMGAERIQEIVLSLRNFSRMDESEYKQVDLHEGIESTLLIVQHRFKANHDRPMIQLVKDYGDLPPIECAAGLVNQVFMNLISNAIDAMETAYQTGLIAQPEITVRTAAIDGGVAVSIIDNGTGIPETVRDRLFDPFFTTKPVGKGTGLGLSISYQIITEKHQGKLECFSSVGEGTEFRIWLPQ